MDRLGQVEGEDHKGEAEGRGPTPTLSELRPYTGYLLEGRRWGAGGGLTRNPLPAKGGQREPNAAICGVGREE